MTKARNVYVASSWANEEYYDQVVRALRDVGHSVYSFKEANSHFKWSELDPNWTNWTPIQFIEALETDQSADAFESDYAALEACDTLVLVTPCGRSAHLEFGFAAGQNKDVYYLVNPGFTAELMAMVGHVVDSIDDLLFHLEDDVRQS
jgi:nucleoside 2-deoxyribosyltransferase